jgi:hypothetical protein
VNTEVTTRTTDQPMPFMWRATFIEGAGLTMEVGDQFKRVPLFPATEQGITQQVGFEMIGKGLRLAGFDGDDAQMAMGLILAMRGIVL